MEEKEVVVTVKVAVDGQISITTNVPALETALLLSEGTSYVISKEREERKKSYTAKLSEDVAQDTEGK